MYILAINTKMVKIGYGLSGAAINVPTARKCKIPNLIKYSGYKIYVKPLIKPA